MTKKLLPFLITIFFSISSFAQLSVLKMTGKESRYSKIGYGLFANLSIPVNEAGNQHAVLELMDVAYFPSKEEGDFLIAYISVKARFRNVFSSEGNTGFLLEPQVGYCRVVRRGEYKATYGDGVAVAVVGGYSLEVDDRGNSIVFGLKYERDMAGREHTLQAVGFRVLYSFSIGRRRGY
ncbi:MAG: hypothetical protein QM763_17560 [Agriterribacter sp.]